MKTKREIQSTSFSLLQISAICFAFHGLNCIIDNNVFQHFLNNSTSQVSTSAFPDYKTAYFYNLRNYYPYNQEGSCGYVSVCMLLAYYDSFWSDSIVPSCYESNSFSEASDYPYSRESPGITREDGEYSIDNFYDWIEDNNDRYLQARMFQVGLDLNFDLTGVDEYGERVFTLGSVYDTKYRLISSYLSDYLGMQSDSYSVSGIDGSYSNSNITRTFIVGELLSGRPVLYGCANRVNVNGEIKYLNAHSLIAYEYDSVNDIIYSHPGLGGNATRVNMEQEYSNLKYSDALTLSFNTEKSPADSYVLRMNDDSIEMCRYNDPDRNIWHYHWYEYTGDYSSSDHEIACARCECVRHEGHDTEYVVNSSLFHSLVCDCGYSVRQTHNWREQITIYGRKRTCRVCGYTQYV